MCRKTRSHALNQESEFTARGHRKAQRTCPVALDGGCAGAAMEESKNCRNAEKEKELRRRQTRSNQHTHARLGAVVTDNGHGVLAGHLLELKAVAALGLVRQVEEVAVWHVGE